MIVMLVSLVLSWLVLIVMVVGAISARVFRRHGNMQWALRCSIIAFCAGVVVTAQLLPMAFASQDWFVLAVACASLFLTLREYRFSSRLSRP